MRFRLIACEVLAREVYLCAAHSPHIVDVELVEKGLHNSPDVLRSELQERIDTTRPGIYDAILLGYGLCGNTVIGLSAHDIPLVVPRAHDCITLYLGSKEVYNQHFSENPGTYYYTADYIERNSSDKDGMVVSLGASTQVDMQEVYGEYVTKYGKDNADYLMEVMGAWSQHYSRAVYIDHEETRFLNYEKVAVDEASRRGWQYEKIIGSLLLLRRLVVGEWPDKDFLTVKPGQTIAASYDSQIMCAS
jgi:hypothetical protein